MPFNTHKHTKLNSYYFRPPPLETKERKILHNIKLCS